MATQVIMPQLGESVVEGTVTKWLKKQHERIQEFEPLVEINTDKVDTEVPSPATGTVLQLFVTEGETVKAGTLLALIGEPGEELTEIAAAGREDGEFVAPAKRDLGEPFDPSAPLRVHGLRAVSTVEPLGRAVEPGPRAFPQPSVSDERAEAASPAKPGAAAELGFISPVVARVAAEHGVDLAQVTGTGGGGRITKKDVLAFVEGRKAAPPWDEPASGELFRPTEEVFGELRPLATAPAKKVQPLDVVRARIADHMVRSKHTSPHVTTVMEADLGRVLAHRQANKQAFEGDGVNLTLTAYFVAASVAALKQVPVVNSSWSDQGIVLHPQANIGVAVSLGEKGLIVPVVKAADQLSLLEIARAINDLAERARHRKLEIDEVQGGTFTITNHGVGGSLFATPIINQPQCAILGVGALQKRVVVIEGKGPSGESSDSLAVRPMVYVTLTFDHRIIDGAIADHFLGIVVQRLQAWA